MTPSHGSSITDEYAAITFRGSSWASVAGTVAPTMARVVRPANSARRRVVMSAPSSSRTGRAVLLRSAGDPSAGHRRRRVRQVSSRTRVAERGGTVACGAASGRGAARSGCARSPEAMLPGSCSSTRTGPPVSGRSGDAPWRPDPSAAHARGGAVPPGDPADQLATDAGRWCGPSWGRWPPLASTTQAPCCGRRDRPRPRPSRADPRPRDCNIIAMSPRRTPILRAWRRPAPPHEDATLAAVLADLDRLVAVVAADVGEAPDVVRPSVEHAARLLGRPRRPGGRRRGDAPGGHGRGARRGCRGTGCWTGT